MIHSLEAFNSLKIDNENNIQFSCQKTDKREINIQQEYSKGDVGNPMEQTHFDKLYSIKVWRPTLRELLVFKSIFFSKTQEKIVELIRMQPSPIVFFKSLLEFDGSNMVSLLSFDSRSMMYLLSPDFKKFFSSEYPIFYRNKFNKGSETKPKYYYRNAVDQALNAN